MIILIIPAAILRSVSNKVLIKAFTKLVYCAIEDANKFEPSVKNIAV